MEPPRNYEESSVNGITSHTISNTTDDSSSLTPSFVANNTERENRNVNEPMIDNDKKISARHDSRQDDGVSYNGFVQSPMKLSQESNTTRGEIRTENGGGFPLASSSFSNVQRSNGHGGRNKSNGNAHSNSPSHQSRTPSATLLDDSRSVGQETPTLTDGTSSPHGSSTNTSSPSSKLPSKTSESKTLNTANNKRDSNDTTEGETTAPTKEGEARTAPNKKNPSDLPRKKNLDERTLKALKSYLESGDFLRSEPLEYEEVAAYEHKLHKYTTERMRVRQIMLLPEAVGGSSNTKSNRQGGMVSDEEWMYNQLYQEEEFFSIANGFAKSVANEAADRESSTFKLHNKTFNWVKRAAGMTRPYDPYSQHRPNSLLGEALTMQQGGDDDSDDETDEGGESDTGPTGRSGRLTRGRVRMTRKKRREERLEKESEGLRILADVAKEMKKKKTKQLAEERKRRKKQKQKDGRASDYSIASSDDDLFGIRESRIPRAREIFPPLQSDPLDSRASGREIQDPLPLSMLDWNERMNTDEEVHHLSTDQRTDLPHYVSAMGLEYRHPKLQVSSVRSSKKDCQLMRRKFIANALGSSGDDIRERDGFSAYRSIPIGSEVLAFHPKLESEERGKVLLHDYDKGEYLVQFHEKELGWHVCNESDVVEDRKLVLSDSDGEAISLNLTQRHEIDRDIHTTLLVALKETYDRKLKILRALELIAEDKGLRSSADGKEQTKWLIQNLEHVNSTMNAVLRRFQRLYGKLYADPESALKIASIEAGRKRLPRHPTSNNMAFLDWTSNLESISNNIEKLLLRDVSTEQATAPNSTTRLKHILTGSTHLLLLANYLEQEIGESESSRKSSSALDAAFQHAMGLAIQHTFPPQIETELVDKENLLKDSKLESAFVKLGDAVGMLRTELSLASEAG